MTSPIDRNEQRAAVRAVRDVWGARHEASTGRDLAYAVYLAVATAAILGVPAARAAGSALTHPQVLPLLGAGVAPQITTAVVLLGAAALVLVGAVRGPALLTPFLTSALACGPQPRRSALWRPFARALLVLVLACASTAVLIDVALVTGAGAAPAAAAWFVLAALGTALLLGGAWLLGELLPAGPRRLAAVILVQLAVVAAWLPVPLGPGAAYPVHTQSGAIWAEGLALVGVTVAGACVPLLDRLRGQVLLEQALRWESAATTATTGDLAGAGAMYRARPTTGRALVAIGAGPLALVYLRRDAVAWLRTPERTVVGALGVIGSAAALTWGTITDGPLAWGAQAAGVLGLWLASSPFVEGIRHAVHTLGAPPLFGQRASVQALLHALAPALLLMMLGALTGGTTAMLMSTPVEAALEVALLLLALAPVLVALRVHAAAKGPMPPELMTPMPTAQGDASVLVMLAWQADAILLALLAGGAIVVAAGNGWPWLLVAVPAATLGIVRRTRRRFRALTS